MQTKKPPGVIPLYPEISEREAMRHVLALVNAQSLAKPLLDMIRFLRNCPPGLVEEVLRRREGRPQETGAGSRFLLCKKKGKASTSSG